MHGQLRFRILLFLLLTPAAFTSQAEYSPARVVYDVSTGDPEALQHLLDRASLLQKLYGNDPFDASIVIVIHDAAIPLFTNHGSDRSGLVARAQSLTAAEIIQFRLCLASARMQGFEASDFDEFIRLVPMADAEIVQLQREGYAYLR